MMRTYEWASLVTIYRNTKILDVDFQTQANNEDEAGHAAGDETEFVNLLDGVSLRIAPPKASVMGPKDEFVACTTLLLCLNYQCDVDVFTAVNESGLVYDGGVVVNEVQ
jgi:hypothetical protein